MVTGGKFFIFVGLGGEVSKIEFRAVARQDMADVFDLLRTISPFVPAPEIYDEIWTDFHRQENLIAIVVDVEGITAGYGVILIEQKIRGGKVGHIEDIVMHPQHRGTGLGRELVEALAKEALNLGCYKVALHCQPHNVAFYEKCGFSGSGNSMQRFLPPHD